MSELSEFTDLHELRLSNNPGITDASCETLRKLTELRFLSITDTEITVAGLRKLAALPNLSWIQLNLVKRLNEIDLAELRRFPSLQGLSV